MSSIDDGRLVWELERIASNVTMRDIDQFDVHDADDIREVGLAMLRKAREIIFHGKARAA